MTPNRPPVLDEIPQTWKSEQQREFWNVVRFILKFFVVFTCTSLVVWVIFNLPIPNG